MSQIRPTIPALAAPLEKVMIIRPWIDRFIVPGVMAISAAIFANVVQSRMMAQDLKETHVQIDKLSEQMNSLYPRIQQLEKDSAKEDLRAVENARKLDKIEQALLHMTEGVSQTQGDVKVLLDRTAPKNTR